MENVSAVAVGVGGEVVVFGIDLDAGDGEVGYAVGDAAGEVPGWWGTMGAPICEGRGEQEEEEKTELQGLAEGELEAEMRDEEGGCFCGVALEDALQLDHAGEWCGIEQPRKDGAAET